MISGNGQAPSSAGVGELVGQASEQTSHLLRAELRLAVAELKDQAKHTGRGAALCGAAAVIAAYGAAAVMLAAIAALALALPYWASALIVGAVLLVVAGVGGLLGTRQLKRGVPPVPHEAAESVKRDISEIKQRTRR